MKVSNLIIAPGVSSVPTSPRVKESNQIDRKTQITLHVCVCVCVCVRVCLRHRPHDSLSLHIAPYWGLQLYRTNSNNNNFGKICAPRKMGAPGVAR